MRYKLRLSNCDRHFYLDLLVERRWWIFWWWRKIDFFEGTMLMVCHKTGVWQKEYQIPDELIEDLTTDL